MKKNKRYSFISQLYLVIYGNKWFSSPYKGSEGMNKITGRFTFIQEMCVLNSHAILWAGLYPAFLAPPSKESITSLKKWNNTHKKKKKEAN